MIEGRKKILIIFLFGDLYHPKAGNETRLFNFINFLSNNNCIITLETKKVKNGTNDTNSTNDKIKYFLEPLNFFGHNFGTFFADFNPFYMIKLLEIIKKNHPDFIQISYPHGLIVAKIFQKLFQENFFIIYDSHDVEVTRHREVTISDKKMSIIKRYFILFFDTIFEFTACKLADYIITISKNDCQKLQKIYSIKSKKFLIVPTGSPKINFDLYEKSICRNKLGLDQENIIIIFHGVLNYYPNYEAITLIRDYIAPKIYELSNNSIFVIAGNGLPILQEKNVIFLGFVKDLNELLLSADIAIVPLLRGGGTKVKIFDYMSAGLPVITTKKGAEGIDLESDKNSIILDNVNQDFINALYELVLDKNKRNFLGHNIRVLAEKEYDWEVIISKLNEKYDKILHGN